MQKTLLFSNVVGDVTSNCNEDIRFNKFMEEYLTNNVKANSKMVFINAPGLGGEENYLKNIIKCFENIGIKFSEIFDLDLNSNAGGLEEFISNEEGIVYFLMGGNPLTQMEIINKFNLKGRIKNHQGLVIGFCAGAINLSKHSIITTDEDFEKCESYDGIQRINIIIEPHYNTCDDKKRNEEILNFAKQYNQKIYAIPDKSIIVVEKEKITEYGPIYHIDNYICKIATLEEIIRKADYEINRHPGNNIWVEFKERAIKNFKKGNSITYIGILNDEIICEATAIIKFEGFKGDINNPEGLLTNNMVYLSGFRTNKEFEGKGYFSEMFKYMENDLKTRGYTKMSLGVEPCEVRNMQIYFHWGFTNYIKTTMEHLPTKDEKSRPQEEIINYYYKEI